MDDSFPWTSNVNEQKTNGKETPTVQYLENEKVQIP